MRLANTEVKKMSNKQGNFEKCLADDLISDPVEEGLQS